MSASKQKTTRRKKAVQREKVTETPLERLIRERGLKPYKGYRPPSRPVWPDDESVDEFLKAREQWRREGFERLGPGSGDGEGDSAMGSAAKDKAKRVAQKAPARKKKPVKQKSIGEVRLEKIIRESGKKPVIGYRPPRFPIVPEDQSADDFLKAREEWHREGHDRGLDL